MQQPSTGSTANSSNSKNTQPTKSTALSKTDSSGNVPSANVSSNNAGNAIKKAKGPPSKRANNAQNEDSNNDDFHNWCTKTLSAKHGDVIDGKEQNNISFNSYLLLQFSIINQKFKHFDSSNLQYRHSYCFCATSNHRSK